MSELFAWVPWFQELAKKIAARGSEYLIACAKEIPWNKDGAKSRLLKYGDENIDPLSFFYVLASKNGTTRVHSAITEAFHLSAKVDFEAKFYYPTPQARAKLLFHSGGRGNTDLLWRLFRSAVTGLDSIKGQEFNEALSIKNVGISKLTEALFLINPREFLPFDKKSLIPLQKKLNRANQVNNWETYRREVDAVRKLFPECEPYEIQHFAYAVFGREDLDVKEGTVWQSNKYLEENNGRDYWSEFRENGWVRHQRESGIYLLRPKPGDLVLVRKESGEGCGIGVVYRNDYKGDWAPKQRLHVLWLNARSAAMKQGRATAFPFSRADKTLDAFRGTPEYAPTFDLLEKIGWNESDGLDDDQPLDLEKGQGRTQPPDLKALADDTLIPEEELAEIKKLLDDKEQVIFQGPPGTGKTYLARKLAECLAGSPDRVRLVQFHPSYAYEDFVQGFRPTLEDKQAGFTLRDGPVVEMANAARKSEEKHFLIIDEINRGNLSKILGELYFLLEYRDEGIQLQYSDPDKKFSLPRNLCIIGTMNTADRSIALVDLALRRRFHFVNFHPDKGLIKGLLGHWLNKHRLEKFLWLERVLQKANEKLDDQHAAIGPSYFMPKDKKLDDERVRRIWKHNVLPYIEERLFGQHNRLDEFDLKKLRGELEGRSADEGAPENSDPTDANP